MSHAAQTLSVWSSDAEQESVQTEAAWMSYKFVC